MVDRWMFYSYEYRDLDDYNLYDFINNVEEFEEDFEDMVRGYEDIIHDSQFFDVYEQDEDNELW